MFKFCQHVSLVTKLDKRNNLKVQSKLRVSMELDNFSIKTFKLEGDQIFSDDSKKLQRNE